MCYYCGVKALQDYLYDTFGVTTALKQEREKVKWLPLYLRGNYDFYSGSLSGQKLIWAIVKNPDSVTPEQLKMQSLALKKVLDHVPVVYVFERLEPWQRKRLIEKKVGFAEPFRQLYIPQLFTQIREGNSKANTMSIAGKEIKAPAQLFLLYHLQVQRLEGLLLQEIAGILNYSAMTITRAVKELAANELLRVEGRKEKTILFEYQGKGLWEKAMPLMASPVRETWYTDNQPPNEYLRIGGETALAHYSMLAEPGQSTYVIGKEAFRISKPQVGKLHSKYGFHKIEIWNYEPTILSKASEIDKLSLYLSLKNHEDERVQGALHNMINEMAWL